MQPLLKIAAASLSLTVFLQARGEVINARSLAFVDVESAVSSARDGDRVVVPAGKEEWKSTLSVTKAITLQFAGIGHSVILDDIIPQKPNGNPRWSQAVVSFSTKRDKLYRLTGLEIDNSRKKTNVFFAGAVQISGSTTGFRIDHCAFFKVLNNDIYAWDSACGVIDHCVFNMQGEHAVAISHPLWAGQSCGDGSWDTPAGWGTSNAVYMEDCVFSNATQRPGMAAVDSFSGARWVFRHNKVFNANLVTHGTESTGRQRGTRSCEIYLNEFSHANNWPETVNLRSASAVVWSNTASGYRAFCALHNYRNTDAFKYWGGADGRNPLDKNEAGPVLVATHTGPAGSPVLIVSSANWKANQWAGYSVIDVNNHQFGMVYSNTAAQAFLIGPAAHQPTVFNTGDAIQFYKVMAALDMPGMGQCGPLKRDGPGGEPQPPWPNQQIEPIYCWGNTLNGADGRVTTEYGVIIEGVHYFNDTPKPGYAPFTYPHPLALAR